MYRIPADSARTVFAVAVVNAVAIWSTAAAAQTIYQCSMSDGAVIFSDTKCLGAATVKKWRPEPLSMGMKRTALRPKPLPAKQPASDLILGYKDPYVDCRERGGKFHLTARLCRLPSKTQTKFQRLP